MAYGSATVRAKTTTKTSSAIAVQSTAAPVASTSRLPATGGRRLSAESQPDLPTSDSEDSEFGPKAREKVKKEARREAKRLADDLASKGSKGKRKRKSVKAEPTDSSADEKRVKPPRKRSINAEPDPSRREGTSADDSSAVDATHAPVKVKKERRGDYKRIRRQGSDGKDLTHDPVVRRHLQGKWRSPWQRAHPEFMSQARAELETIYNPLPKLLGIELQLIDSEEERGTLRLATKAGYNLDQDDWSISDDSEASSSAERDRKAKIASTAFNWKKSMDTDEDSDEDAKPKRRPVAAAPLPTSRDIKPTPADEPESDPEPDTEDEDGAVVIKSEEIKVKLEEDDDEEDDFARRIRLTSEAKARKAAAAKVAQKKNEDIDRRLSALRAEQNSARVAQDELMDVDEEPVLTISQERLRDHQQKLVDAKRYPMLIKEVRPEFQITSRKQEETGPLVLAPGVEVPATINRFLRDYQRDGVKFMYRQFASGMGGVLGDDMGLGKTIQVIAFLAAIMKKTGKEQDDGRRKAAINAHRDGFLAPEAHGVTCLISCPASVVHNWAREFKTWGYFAVGVYEGTNRKDILSYYHKGYLDVVIAGIDATRTNIGDLASESFGIVIVDEAHRIKNPNSITTKALHLFPTKLRFGLTGTAIQNNLEELWCVLDWANPGHVGVKNNWNIYISRPLKYSQKIDVDQDVLATGRQRAEALVFKLLPHFWLRRTKDMVHLQLPKKTDLIVLCPLTATQKRVYKKILASEDVKRILTNEDPCDCGILDIDGMPYKRRNCCDKAWHKLILKHITLFQKISNHLALIYPDKEEKITNPDKYNQDFEWARAAFPDDFSKRTRGGLSSLDPSLCGKWPILEQLLARWYERGDKVLIFSLSLKILDLIKDLMAQTQYRFVTLDGSVPPEQRMALVDTFNDEPDCFCFLISTRAGGVGLNLTAANRVVIFDPNWNPSHDLQAMDRAYRFGQQRDVDVYRLIRSGTLEELIYNRQQYKRAQMSMGYDATAERRQFTGVEGDKEDRGELFGCKNIFRFYEHSSLTEMTIQACNIAELEFALKNTGIYDASASKKKGDNWDAENDSGDGGIEEEEIIKQIAGAAREAPMSKEDLARAEKTKAERDAIADILAQNRVTFHVESDATLGGSRAEQDRSRRAIAETKTHKGRDSSSLPMKAKAAPRAVVATSTWDPSARRVGKAKLNAPPAPPKAPSPKLETNSEMHESIAASLGIDPGVNFGELVAPAGYEGSKGQKRLVAELAELDRKQYEKRIREVLQAYVTKSRA